MYAAINDTSALLLIPRFTVDNNYQFSIILPSAATAAATATAAA
jgi:hypothetical protein